MDRVWKRDEILSTIETEFNRVRYDYFNKRKTFKKIVIDGVYTKWVKCVQCPNLWIANYDHGGHGLSYHESNFHGNKSHQQSSQPTLHHYVRAKINKDEKEKVSRASALCTATDLLPFTFTEGEGIKGLIDVIAKICHDNKGRLYTDDILPCAKTNKTYAIKIRDEIKVLMKGEMKRIAAIHTTCDHWKEDISNREFFTVSVHYVSNDPIDIGIKSSIIATVETSCKTAAQIFGDYRGVIGDDDDGYKIQDKIKSVTTDSAAANISAFKF